MKVSELMTKAAVTDAPDDTLAEAAAKMRAQQTGSLLIMDVAALAGIVTERGVLKVVGDGQDPKSVSIRDVMTPEPVTVGPDSTIQEAAKIMFDKWFRHLPVTTGDGDV